MSVVDKQVRPSVSIATRYSQVPVAGLATACVVMASGLSCGLLARRAL
jgi:hypothetical protein